MIPDDTRAALRAAARAASAHAYCPYSKFRVGAAVLAGSGKVYSGCNVENASFGLTICAERSALAAAISAGETELAAVAIYTPTGMPTAPCGACRQALNEFGPGMACECTCDGPASIDTTLDILLPSSFGPRNLPAM
ncbi:MAG: cytidine deaminase [Gemmataceae bacterium]|nr:cytidine deaminase [Gemmataceae bacterium]